MATARPGDLDRVLARWSESQRLLLFAGRDEGASRLMAARAAGQLAAGQPHTVLTGAAVAARPGLLAEMAASIPLFGGRQVVRVSGTPAELASAVALLLEAPAAGNPVVAETGALRRGDRLQALVEASDAAILIINHPPAPGELAQFVSAEAGRHGLRLPRDAGFRLVEIAGSDRSLLAAEVEKLALYLGAAPGAPAAASVADVEAVASGGAEAEEAGRLALAILAGDGGTVARELRTAGRSGAIPALRALGARLLLALELAHRVAGGDSPRAAVEAARPPIFWKEQEPMIRALERWPVPALEAALETCLAAEAAIKARASAGEVLALQALAMLAAAPGVPPRTGFG